MGAKDVLGSRGEQLAADQLLTQGLRIVDRNWRCREGEIDIVACEGPVLVIVEVKTRTTRRYGTPFEAITERKANRLRYLAARWLRENPGTYSGLRFDVVTVEPDPSGALVAEHRPGVI